MNQKSRDEHRPDSMKQDPSRDQKTSLSHPEKKENMPDETGHAKKTDHRKGRTTSSKERGGIL